MSLGLFIWKSVYFFLPVYVAAMMPVLFRKITFLNQKVSEKMFGENKTWRGVVVAILGGVLVFGIQKIVYSSGIVRNTLIDYEGFSLLMGLFMGMGTVIGDLVMSYYKRKAGVREGTAWIPGDQSGFVIGGLLGGFVFYVPYVNVVLLLLLISPLLQIVFKYVGFLLGISEKKW